MVFIITLLISAIFWLGVINMQHMYGQGVAWRIAILIFLFFLGVGFIYAGIIAPPGPRAVLLQIGAAFITTIPVIIGYISFKNKRGWL